MENKHSTSGLKKPSPSLTVDCHVDIPWIMYKAATNGKELNLSQNNKGADSAVDFPRMKRGGLDAAFFALYLSDYVQDDIGPIRTKIEIQNEINYIDSQDGCCIVDRLEDALLVYDGGKTPIFLGLEGGRLIHNDLDLLATYRSQGVRYLTITHNLNTSWADSSTDYPCTKGLSRFGKEVIRKCSKLGVLSDISHCSDETAFDVLSTASIPVIASHSGCRGLRPLHRNIPDDLIKGVALTKGVVHIPFTKRMVGSFQDIPKHIDHVIQLVGDDYVGIGSDFDGAVMVNGMDSVENWDRFKSGLSTHYSDETITKIMGGNTLRLMEAS